MDAREPSRSGAAATGALQQRFVITGELHSEVKLALVAEGE